MKILKILYIILVGLFCSATWALYYGDDYMYPKMTNNLRGYYEVHYALAYFNESNIYRLYDSLQFNYNMSDDLVVSLQKKYISSQLTFGLLYKFMPDIDFGEIGIGVRNLGMRYSDTNSPFPQEFLTYSFPFRNYKINVGAERIINNGSDLFTLFGGAEGDVMENLRLFMFYSYNYIGAGLKMPLMSGVDVSLSGYGVAQGAAAGDNKVIELAFTLFNISKSQAAHASDLYSNNRFTTEALHRLKSQEKMLHSTIAKVKAIEYLYSEKFQQRLIDELIQQRIVEKEIRSSETQLLKTTLKHIQKGLEYFYLNDLEKAYQEYQLANSLYPNMPLIHERLGSIYYKLGHFDKAKQEWLLTLSLDPDNKDAQKFLKLLREEKPDLFGIMEPSKDTSMTPEETEPETVEKSGSQQEDLPVKGEGQIQTGQEETHEE